MKNFLQRIKISRKLFLISLAYFIPIVALVYHVVDGINVNIDFAQYEKYGNSYLRPLSKLLKLVGEHRLASEELSRGKESGFNIETLKSEIDQGFAALSATHDELGETLQFTEEGLGKRNRSNLKLENVKERWESIKSLVISNNTAEVTKAHKDLIADIRGMIAHAGDTSNLILDPDLDSYYLMDVTLLALPQTQDRLIDIISAASEAIAAGTLTAETKINMAVFASMLKEADVVRVDASSQVSLIEDQNFYGPLESYQSKYPPLLEQYKKDNEIVLGLLASLVSNDGTSVSWADFETAGLKARETSFALWDLGVSELDKLFDVRIGHYRTSILNDLLPSLVCFVLASTLVFLISRSINNPLAVIESRLFHSTEGVRAAAEELSSGSQALAQGATEQAASLQTTAASIEQISSVSKGTSENSQQATSITEDVQKLSDSGFGAMQEMKSAVADIKKSAEETFEIVKIIDSIAFQTNLLALNAAVEAARAGEAGKGFAVVAEEVRNLAQRSSQAAKETTEKIKRSTELASNGVKVTLDVEKYLSKIRDQAVKAANIVKEISAASSEQSLGITQVDQAIVELDSVTQSNSASAEQAAASSQLLLVQANSMGDMVLELRSLIHGPKEAEPKSAASLS